MSVIIDGIIFVFSTIHILSDNDLLSLAHVAIFLINVTINYVCCVCIYGYTGTCVAFGGSRCTGLGMNL